MSQQSTSIQHSKRLTEPSRAFAFGLLFYTHETPRMIHWSPPSATQFRDWEQPCNLHAITISAEQRERAQEKHTHTESCELPAGPTSSSSTRKSRTVTQRPREVLFRWNSGRWQIASVQWPNVTWIRGSRNPALHNMNQSLQRWQLRAVWAHGTACSRGKGEKIVAFWSRIVESHNSSTGCALIPDLHSDFRLAFIKSVFSDQK